MTKLIIWSSFRSGSHQLRSMLREEKFSDEGEHFTSDLFEAACKAHPRSAQMFNFKFGNTAEMFLKDQVQSVQAIPVDIKVLVLHRNDLFAQQASMQFAMANNAFEAPPEAVQPIEMDMTRAGRSMFLFALQLHQLLLWLPPLPMATIAYEDLTKVKVTKVLSGLLERDVNIVDPATKKSAPPLLEDFVTNINPNLKVVEK